MGITDQIVELLRKEYQDGATYQQMATRHNVSLQHVRDLAVGKNKPGKMSLETLMRMFPRAQIVLEPPVTVTAENSGVNNGVIGINHGTVSAASVEAFRHKIQDEIIRADVDSESKVKILNIILNTELK